MAVEPALVVFHCESCDFEVSTDARAGNHLLPWKRKIAIEQNGLCRKCGGDSWTISVFYAEADMDVGASAFGLGVGALTGVGFTQSSTAVNQTDYSNVSAEIVAQIIEAPPARMERVVSFTAARARQDLKENGAMECRACEALFVPTPDKPWSAKGFCSKMCAFETEGPSAIGETGEARKNTATKANTVRVECSDGHEFEVSISFRGLPRRCPECGLKTLVPDGQS